MFLFKKILLLIIIIMTTRNNNEQKTEYVSKPGKTLLVKLMQNNDSKLQLNNLKGLLSKSETKLGTSSFLTFDKVENATNAMEHLVKMGYQVKYSYYRVFFILDKSDDSLDYMKTKTELTDLVTSKFGGTDSIL
jgi:hypothetical protein